MLHGIDYIPLTQCTSLVFIWGLPNSIKNLCPKITCKIAQNFIPLIIENSSLSEGFISLSIFEIRENGLRIFSININYNNSLFLNMKLYWLKYLLIGPCSDLGR